VWVSVTAIDDPAHVVVPAAEVPVAGLVAGALVAAGVAAGVPAAGVALAVDAAGVGDAGLDAGLDGPAADAEVDAPGAVAELAQAASSAAHPIAPRPASTDLVSVTIHPFGRCFRSTG
jgi:hypothetical protein